MIDYHLARSSANILNIRRDSISQLLNLASIRPGGRYLVVEDTSGLVLAAILQPEREEVVEGQDDAKTLKTKQKELAKQRKRDAVLAELNGLRDELHQGNWDG
jgi:hypothetical protein